MKELPFALLSFVEDENLEGRTYWYLSPFPVKEGEEVFAPVGARNRLQRAEVVRVLSATEENAPYDVRYIKRVEARVGENSFLVGELPVFDFGGRRYDEKRYTLFRRVLFTNGACEVPGYAAISGSVEELVRGVLRAERALLTGANAADAARELLKIARGRECAFLTREEEKTLRRKLCGSDETGELL